MIQQFEANITASANEFSSSFSGSVQEFSFNLTQNVQEFSSSFSGVIQSFTANLTQGVIYVGVGGSSNYSGSWVDLVNSWTQEPALNTAISGGDVYDYVYGLTTYYRFVPNPYLSTEDAFYYSFSSPNLSGLITRRGNSI